MNKDPIGGYDRILTEELPNSPKYFIDEPPIISREAARELLRVARRTRDFLGIQYLPDGGIRAGLDRAIQQAESEKERSMIEPEDRGIIPEMERSKLLNSLPEIFTLELTCDNPQAKPLVFCSGGKEILRIIADGKVIVSGNTYDSAVEFWEIIRGIVEQYGYKVIKEEKGAEKEIYPIEIHLPSSVSFKCFQCGKSAICLEAKDGKTWECPICQTEYTFYSRLVGRTKRTMRATEPAR